MSVRVSLRGMLRLIQFDTLRRVHTFLVEQLLCSQFRDSFPHAVAFEQIIAKGEIATKKQSLFNNCSL